MHIDQVIEKVATKSASELNSGRKIQQEALERFVKTNAFKNVKVPTISQFTFRKFNQ